MDLIYLLGAASLFLAMLGMVRGCDKLAGQR